MSIIKDLLSYKEDTKLISLLERHVRATERIADALEALLPSPFTSLLNRDLKAPAPEIKIYGEREAYYDELNKRKQEVKELANRWNVEDA